MILLKSSLYREEILRWSLIVVLFIWAMTSTVIALRAKDEVILIGFDETGARTITDEMDSLLKREAVQFLTTFVSGYLNFDHLNHKSQIGKAASLMSESLWGQEQPRLLEINQKLQKEPLTQRAEIQSIDLIGEEQFEVIVEIVVTRKGQESKAKVKFGFSLTKRERTATNPWKFEITQLQEAIL